MHWAYHEHFKLTAESGSFFYRIQTLPIATYLLENNHLLPQNREVFRKYPNISVDLAIKWSHSKIVQEHFSDFLKSTCIKWRSDPVFFWGTDPVLSEARIRIRWKIFRILTTQQIFKMLILSVWKKWREAAIRLDSPHFTLEKIGFKTRYFQS